MVTRKSSAVSVSQSGKAEAFRNVSTELISFSTLLICKSVRAYVGLKDKSVNIVRIFVFYQCISYQGLVEQSMAVLR